MRGDGQREFRDKVAIVGAGVTKAVRHADVPIGALAVAVSDAAIEDAGLTRCDIDGVACGSTYATPAVDIGTAFLYSPDAAASGRARLGGRHERCRRRRAL